REPRWPADRASWGSLALDDLRPVPVLAQGLRKLLRVRPLPVDADLQPVRLSNTHHERLIPRCPRDLLSHSLCLLARLKAPAPDPVDLIVIVRRGRVGRRQR